MGASVQVFRYFAGWADKIQGKTVEVIPVRQVVGQTSDWLYSQTDENKFAYTRHEPYGVVVSGIVFRL